MIAFSVELERGPVTMLNLLKFLPDGGAERYAEYGAAVAPLLDGVGGRVIHAGQPATALIGPADWDLVLLVQYPNNGAFMEMVNSPEYGAIAHLRTEALQRSELHPMYEGDAEKTSESPTED